MDNLITDNQITDKPIADNNNSGNIVFESQLNFNQAIINSLLSILKTNSDIPTYTPTKFLEQFYLYKNNTDYRLYIYLNNEWKYSNLNFEENTNKVVYSTIFETTIGIENTQGGSGGFSLSNSGLFLETGITSSSFIKGVRAFSNNSIFNIFKSGSFFKASVDLNQVETDSSSNGSFFIGMGVINVDGGGHNYTQRHIGFKILKVAGVMNLYATQANNGNETASSSLTTLSAGDILELFIKMNGSSVEYWFRKNDNDISSKTILTTNIPDGSMATIQMSTSNNGSPRRNNITINRMSYER